MGYRHYFYKVKIKDVDELKNISINDIKKKTYDKECEYYDFDKAIDKQEIYELGKLYFDDTAERIYSTGEPLFSNDDVMQMFEDYKPYIVGKKGLLKAIEIYKEKIIIYLSGCLKDSYDEFSKEKIESKYKMEKDIKDRLRNWKSGLAINTNENFKNIVSRSWLYEYSIFNLIYLLKTIDWENETILFYGW